MNTGFLGPAVATVLTVYGIETRYHPDELNGYHCQLQQYLPFTVLKRTNPLLRILLRICCNSTYRLRY